MIPIGAEAAAPPRERRGVMTSCVLRPTREAGLLRHAGARISIVRVPLWDFIVLPLLRSQG
jgi:hypothetical protein